MKKYFGWLLAAITSLSFVTAYADAKVNTIIEEEEIVEEMVPDAEIDEDQVAAVVVDEEEAN